MKILQRVTYKGKEWESGKISYREKDTLNKEKSFNDALNTLMVIREERQNLFNDKPAPYFERNIHGKRKTS